MSETVNAIYERGTLYLATPLALPEHTQVRVQVVAIGEGTNQAISERDRVLAILNEQGLLVSLSEEAQRRAHPVPEAERERIARLLGAAGPLSEVIIADRDSR